MKTEHSHIDIHLITRYLSGEASSDEVARVDDWIRESDANREEFTLFQNTWDKLDSTTPSQEIDVNKEWIYNQKKVKSLGRQESVFKLPVFRVAVSVLLLVSLGLLTYLNYSKQALRSPLAETRELVLPDGSEVTLNAGSKISYSKHFGEDERRIRLQGEAYFDVKPDSTKPFIIQAQDTEVRVLGTAFNVKAYKKDLLVEVTVAEGTVSVYDKNMEQKRVIATAGEHAEFDRQQKTLKKTRNQNQNFISWKTRILRFENDPLLQVTQILEQVYHKRVIVETPNIESCSITAKFEDKELQAVLNVLESTLDIEIELEDDVIYLRGNGCD